LKYEQVAQVLFLLLGFYYLVYNGIAQIPYPKKLFTPLKMVTIWYWKWYMGREIAHVYGVSGNAVVRSP